GFRVYKTGSSNMKKVYYHPEQLTQDNIFSLESNIKEDRSPDDLLTQVILNLGLALNLPIEQKKMHGNSVFIVQTNALVACFDDNINIKIIDEIAQLQPFRVVFKDGGFSESKDRINLEERFKRLSPETLITVI
ncbi:site-specific DNA-methyltransferase, partial [Methylococcaceae bacterium HT5]